LVVGDPAVVRQALPHVALDVVGTSPHDVEVTVVSEAIGTGSLPTRWGCVIVTDAGAMPDRLSAAWAACTPGGVVAVTTLRSEGPARLPCPSTVELTASTRAVHLVIARVPL
jgi:hypothetical protein